MVYDAVPATRSCPEPQFSKAERHRIALAKHHAKSGVEKIGKYPTNIGKSIEATLILNKKKQKRIKFATTRTMMLPLDAGRALNPVELDELGSLCLGRGPAALHHLDLHDHQHVVLEMGCP